MTGAGYGAAYPGSLYEDDVHDFDYVELAAGTVGSPIGETATDLSVEGQGTYTPFCPDNFTMKMDSLAIENAAGSTAQITIQRKSSAATPVTVTLLTVGLATKAGVQLNASLFKLLCYPTWKFQVVSDTAASAVVNALVRLTKGASQ
jgi:hypothetical protein